MSHKFIHIKYKCRALEENIKILSQTVEQGFCVSLLFGGEMFDTAEKCRSASWRSASPRGGHEAQLCAPTCSPGSCALKKTPHLPSPCLLLLHVLRLTGAAGLQRKTQGALSVRTQQEPRRSPERRGMCLWWVTTRISAGKCLHSPI